MTDVVLDRPYGSEFKAASEVPKADLLDVIGVNDIDPANIGDTWQLTPDGKLFVITANAFHESINYLIGPLLHRATTFGVRLADAPSPTGIIYLVTGQAVNHMKQATGIEDGFTFADEPQLTSDRQHIPFSKFFRSRGSGIWTLQAPTIGFEFDSGWPQQREELGALIHDRRLSDHLIAAMAATQPQVDFIATVKEEIDGLTETAGDGHKQPMMEVMMAALLDSTIRGGIDGLLIGPFKENNVPVGAALIQYANGHDVDLVEIGIETFKELRSIFEDIKEEMNLDPRLEQAKAHARAEKIRETFSL